MAIAERKLLFTNAEYLLAQRAWDRMGMYDDPTLDAPELTDADAPEDTEEA